LNADNIDAGSPIIAADGSAIGPVSVSGDDRRRYAYRNSVGTCRDGCCANSISLREFVANPLGGSLALVVVAVAVEAVA
jgi:hypothetical protein